MNAQAAVAAKTRNIIDPDDDLVRKRQNYMPCPHCNAPSRVRSSEMETRTIRNLYVQCQNVDCGFTWKAQLAIVHGLSSSAIPNPTVDITMAPASVTRKTYFPPPDGFDPRQIDIFDSD